MNEELRMKRNSEFRGRGVENYELWIMNEEFRGRGRNEELRIKNEGKFRIQGDGGWNYEWRMKGNSEVGIQRGEDAKKGEVKSLGAGRRDWGNEKFVIWYVCFVIKSAIS